MSTLHGLSISRYGRVCRRDLLRAGALSWLGLGLSDLAALRGHSVANAGAEKRRHNACVFFFLFGGPSQIDLFDMKPAAPVEVRGVFRPASTRVPGIRICEHLPRTARVMDRLCLLRSMTHRMNVHGPACSEVFTGREYFQAPTTDQASREDWPALASMVTRYGKRHGGLPASVVLPWYLQFPGQPRRIAGQTGARMGERHNAFLLQGDLGRSDFVFEGLQLPGDVSPGRLRLRQELLGRLMPHSISTPAVDAHETNAGIARELLTSQASQALDLRRESLATRERYGLTTVGQSLLLARRLVEAGVSLVTVNWQDETKIDGVNTCWDTHQGNFPKLKDLLCPLFDQAFPAFIEDLHERGRLDSTLVVALGEFGRTPKMGQFTQSANTQKTGRDHWPHAFTAILAGGGVRGGQVYGETTADAGYVRDKPVTPADLTATILHHLGIDSTRKYTDEFQHLQHRLSPGKAVRDLG
jgi:hypothetical protein